jgi:hypothetical protein
MLGASAALSGGWPPGAQALHRVSKAGALIVNVESGLEGAVALLDRAHMLNLPQCGLPDDAL